MQATLQKQQRLPPRGFNSLQTGKHIASFSNPLQYLTLNRFNSLQTGKHIARLGGRTPISDFLGFNSLQTGKHIASTAPPPAQQLETTTFQFPSNGKAHRKERAQVYDAIAVLSFQFPSNGKAHRKSPWSLKTMPVAGQFQFPSNGKAHRKMTLASTAASGNYTVFQFPSNGKAHRKCFTQMVSKAEMRFNSLQTGKHIASHGNPTDAAAAWRVSIPFKRESTLQVVFSCIMITSIAFAFQFPSNGKAHRKRRPPTPTTKR